LPVSARTSTRHCSAGCRLRAWRYRT
jgi:hypothetical protein